MNEIISSFKSLFTVNTVHILGKTSTKIKGLVSITNAVLAIWLTTAICAVETMFYNWMLDKDKTMLITVFLKQHTNCSMYDQIYYYPFFDNSVLRLVCDWVDKPCSFDQCPFSMHLFYSSCILYLRYLLLEIESHYSHRSS